MWLLDQIEEKDKEYYDKIFNEYKTAFHKRYDKHCTYTDAEIREYLKNRLETTYDFKADFVYELNYDDLIVDNLEEFTEFFSENVERLLWMQEHYTEDFKPFGVEEWLLKNY